MIWISEVCSRIPIVEDGSQHVDVILRQLLARRYRAVARRYARTNDKNQAVANLAMSLSVRKLDHGRRIDQNQIELFRQFGQQSRNCGRMKDLAEIQVAGRPRGQNEDAVGICVSHTVGTRRANPFPFVLAHVISSPKPSFFSIPKIVCIRGRRRSASMIRTFLPDSAIATAILLTTVVFPSPGPGLVTTMILGWLAAARHQENRSEREAERFGMNRSVADWSTSTAGADWPRLG